MGSELYAGGVREQSDPLPQIEVFPLTRPDRDSFVEAIATSGYAILPNVLRPEAVTRLRGELELAISAEEEYRQSRKVHSNYGMVLLCALYGGEMVEILGDIALMEPFHWLLGEGCILYAYTSSSMPPEGGNYSSRIHVDCPRLIPGYMTNMGATILLDDFTAENGATYFLPGSQHRPDAPPESDFYAGARRVIAPAGSVFYFNARLWHAGGLNTTRRWRHALTMNICRPYMKQRIDIPRALAHLPHQEYSQAIRQKLGFLSRPPASYDEYYASDGERTFSQPYE